MEVSTKHFLKFVPFSKFDLWDTKRYTYQNEMNFDNVVRLSEILIPYKKSVSKEEMIKNNYQIIAKINFGGELFLREKSEIETYKGGLFLVPSNSIIYSKINVRHGCIYFNDENSMPFGVSSEYPVFTFDPTRVNGYFLQKLLRTDAFKKLLNTKSTGISKARVKQDEFLDIQIPLPTLQEQQEVVEAYFSKINEAKQLKLEANQQINNLDLELGIYTSKNIFKTNVINIINYYELDKWGVDKNQLSSVNYNGKFQVLKIKDICLIGSGGTPSRSRKEYYNGTIPWIKTGEVLDDIIYDTEEKITIEAINNSSAKLYKKDSIIIAMYGQGKTRGRTAKLGIDATTNQACAVLYSVNNQVIVNDYLWIFLINEYDRIRELASGNSQPNLNADMIKNYPIVVPPLENQKEIISKYWEFDKIKKLKIKNAEQLKHQANEEFEKAIFQ